MSQTRFIGKSSFELQFKEKDLRGVEKNISALKAKKFENHFSYKKISRLHNYGRRILLLLFVISFRID